jgi:hypothetical protein
MTSQGTSHGRFLRAISHRNLLNAEMATRETGGQQLRQARSRRFFRLLVRTNERGVQMRAKLVYILVVLGLALHALVNAGVGRSPG